MQAIMKISTPSCIFASRFVWSTVFVACFVASSLAAATAQGAAALPDYQPRQQVSGTLRSSGNEQMATLMRRWEHGFRKYHPDIRFADSLKGTASGIYGLEMRTADIAVMGRAMNPFERYGTYERSWTYPVEIEVATGSATTLHKSPAYAILVHKDNPLAKVTVKELDGIFGAKRGGGWKALSWDESAARGNAEDIRTWGRLGLPAPWSNRPIHVYGPPILGAGVITFFQARVLNGGAMWNEDLREYADRAQMIAELRNDPDGIAYAPISYASEGVKALALAETSAGPFVELRPGTVANRSYPLARPVYIDYTIDDKKSDIANPRVDPKTKEFLRYILSREGQQDVVRDGFYLPLPAAVVKEQLNKLDSEDYPPEKVLLGE
jgi:phosphate transport system substrate-binding protein